MTKAQLDLCREVVSMFNKATFNVSGVELLQYAQKVSMFAQMITSEEAKLNSPPVIAENTALLNKPEIKAERAKAIK
jgi:hypothetical protein